MYRTKYRDYEANKAAKNIILDKGSREGKIKITTKRYSPDNGKPIDDDVREYNLRDLESELEKVKAEELKCAEGVDNMKAQKTNLVTMIADAKKVLA